MRILGLVNAFTAIAVNPNLLWDELIVCGTVRWYGPMLWMCNVAVNRIVASWSIRSSGI